MKFVKHLALMAMAAVAAMAFNACNTPSQENKNPNLNHDLTLTVDVENITSTSAKIKVSHNGSAEDTWMGFVTTEVAKGERQLIAEAAAEFAASGDPIDLHASKSYVTVLKGLNPGTDYKYIAFGISEEGEVYGGYGVFEFTTSGGSNVEPDDPNNNDNPGGNDNPVSGMRVNDAWSVSYIGAGTLYDQNFDNIVKVTSVDKNPYLMTVVYASEWNTEGLMELGNYMVSDLIAYIDEFNASYGTSYTLADMLFVGDGYDAFYLEPGYYKAVALGVNEKGSLTGLYAVSDTFEVEEQVATAAFKSWLGNWEIVGNNDVVYNINLSNGLANKYFYMSYWEGDQDFMVQVDYNADLDALFFYSQLVAADVNFGDYGVGNLYFYGFDQGIQLYTNEGGDYGIAIAGILDGGQRAIVRYDDDSIQGYPFFDYMQFIADIDGTYFRLTNAEILQLPAAMNPTGGQIAVAERDRVQAAKKVRRQQRVNLYPKAQPSPLMFAQPKSVEPKSLQSW